MTDVFITIQADRLKDLADTFDVAIGTLHAALHNADASLVLASCEALRTLIAVMQLCPLEETVQ